MTLYEMIRLLRISNRVEIRDRNNWELFRCKSDSDALKPYYDKKVLEWFPGLSLSDESGFTVTLDFEL